MRVDDVVGDGNTCQALPSISAGRALTSRPMSRTRATPEKYCLLLSSRAVCSS